MKPHEEIAVAFAAALVDGDFVRAHEMLSPQLRQTKTPESLREEMYGMFRLYASSEPKQIWFDEAHCLMPWPPEQTNDLGSVYVGIEGDDFVEAVTVTVTKIDGNNLIRAIVWGRP